MNENKRNDATEFRLCSNLPQNTQQFIIVPSFESPQILDHAHFSPLKKPRKKRTKSVRICSGDEGSSSGGVAVLPKPKPKSSVKKPDPEAPKITRPCSECGKTFWSWKALFGHMRCHPERQWRGINPPSNYRRPPISSYLSKADIAVEEALVTEEDQEVATCLLMLANGPTASAAAAFPATAIATAAPIQFQNQGTFVCDSASARDYHHHLDHHLHQVLMDCDGDVTGVLGVGTSNCRFECSSCKKVFGSHQALGGHRASHKNVKGCFAITRNDPEDEDRRFGDDRADAEVSKDSHSMMMMLGHQCSICSRVFSSGQALGGHKRCHWEKAEDSLTLSQGLNSSYPSAAAAAGGGTSRESCGGLDLNLPAPDLHEDSSSSYTSGLALDLRLGLQS